MITFVFYLIIGEYTDSSGHLVPCPCSNVVPLLVPLPLLPPLSPGVAATEHPLGRDKLHQPDGQSAYLSTKTFYKEELLQLWDSSLIGNLCNKIV